ncbi:hypothetical protein AB6A40_004237 [Gnathostoma spinigerum]|uniref:2-(3-amino-3-carboxypropyl)histidine synthase subunit 1 n=1 Tax=Gnathostoma spinigerum TaxID=75299 RepID=A0ABD6EBX2_9BILA
MPSQMSGMRARLDEISRNEELRKDMQVLPSNYDFEIPKTLLRIETTQSKYVALQFPEGLLLYSCAIADILHKYAGCETLIMGDITYGACCVDDYTARALGCDLLIHYGHSCLVPIQNTVGINMLYVFVNIEMDLSHFVGILKKNFRRDQKIALISTIQFVVSLQQLKNQLVSDGYDIITPQCKPLSPGEVLGCTSPRLSSDVTEMIYVGDGRFHLESAMIHNPSVNTYQYDPYSRIFSKESFDFSLMKKNRGRAIQLARNAKTFGLIQGTLGRQGNIKIVEDLERKLEAAGKKFIRVLLSEIFPEKLEMFNDVDCWVQVACPRLSIDWGEAFSRPLLTPYELAVALDHVEFRKDCYPMDYYSDESLGPWTNNHESLRPPRPKRQHLPVVATP